MSSKKVALVLKAVMAILPIASFAANAGAATEKVLWSFKATPLPNTVYPSVGLIMDKTGDLFGTTSAAGVSGGTVFELSPGPDGAWTEKVIYTFSGKGKDGTYPNAGLVVDASGNLYGTTQSGGANDLGTVFELTPADGGKWTETVAYSFGQVKRSGNPSAGLVIDGAGNLYGTTYLGGDTNYLQIFELTPAAGGTWTETALLSSPYPNLDGWVMNPLIIDAAGNLYGTTFYTTTKGCACAGGTAFELSPQGGGRWIWTVLHNFGSGEDGVGPTAGLVFDGSGNLYGVTASGGTQGDGAVFELKPQEGGGWTEEILHSFHTEGTGGIDPAGGLIFDGKGNFYGTTSEGGADGDGEFFEFTPIEGGGWEHTVLHGFGHGLDGQQPGGGLIVDASGNVYGATALGGAYGYGTVFEIIP